MGFKRHWTHEQDEYIRQSRAARRSWDLIALDLASSRSSVIDRGRRLGVPRAERPAPAEREEPMLRDALAAGHPITWETLTAGTSLAATPYPFPPFAWSEP